MRLKLDENIDERLVVLLRDVGHDASTIREQGLHGTVDPELYNHIVSDGRVLVTLDLDFSNVLRYPPEPTPGLVVLRGPDDLFPTVRILVQTLISALAIDSPAGRLWIVEPSRIRIHE
jgi:predicted nuclease of predicted toxin-antitoxin system